MSVENYRRSTHLFTSESVTMGHPDKVADQISDGVLDAILKEDPRARVACETLVTTGQCIVAGEITTEAYVDVSQIARDIIKTFTDDTSIDKVFLVYTEFKTVLSQKPVIEQILPIPRIEQIEEGEDAGGMQAEYIYEQPAVEIFGKLLPKQVETQLYKSMLESVASEQGSRMTAMDSASKNAGELMVCLTLNMNRIRQAAITKEIIEVVSGAAAAAK